MKRRQLVVAAAALGVSDGVWAQPVPGKVWRIGFLSESWPRTPLSTFVLTSTGFVEGRDFVVDYKFAEGRRDRLPTLAAELVAAKPDVIVGLLNPEIMALKRATTTIPIVMMYASGPVEMGFIQSLAKPGGNITGTTTSVPEMGGKMVQVLRDTLPRMKRVTWLTDLSYPGISLYTKSTEDAAIAFGLSSQTKDIRTSADLDSAISAIEREKPDAIYIVMVGVVAERFMQIVEAAARLRIPAMYSIRGPVAAGGLMSYSPDFAAMALRNASMINKILRGTKPADIPVEEPAKFLLSINMKTARALGLTIPQKVLISADELIE